MTLPSGSRHPAAGVVASGPPSGHGASTRLVVLLPPDAGGGTPGS